MTRAAATPERTPGSLRAAIDGAHRRLSAAGVPSPRHDAEVLAAFVIGCPRCRLLVAGDLSAGQQLGVHRTRDSPRIADPVAAPHWQRAVSATSSWPSGPASSCRDPRPRSSPAGASTRSAMRAIQRRREPALVVDLCTGSGVIALSIAQEVKGTVVHAVEREAAAFTWAQRNVTGSRVVVHHGDAAHRAGRTRRSRRPGRQQPAVPARDAARQTSNPRFAITIRPPRCGAALTVWTVRA